MYAIIRAGGHQEKVTVGETITVDRLKQDPESEITFQPLMISGDDGTVVTDRKQLADTGLVRGRVVEHVKGDKLDVYHYKNKTGFRKHTGHRSMLTLVEISEIKLGDKRMTLDDAKVAKEKADAAKVEERKAVAEAKEKAKAERTEKEKARKTAAAAKKSASGASGAKKAPAKKKSSKAK